MNDRFVLGASTREAKDTELKIEENGVLHADSIA
jgi:hypothetical protein